MRHYIWCLTSCQLYVWSPQITESSGFLDWAIYFTTLTRNHACNVSWIPIKVLIFKVILIYSASMKTGYWQHAECRGRKHDGCKQWGKPHVHEEKDENLGEGRKHTQTDWTTVYLTREQENTTLVEWSQLLWTVILLFIYYLLTLTYCAAATAANRPRLAPIPITANNSEN